MGAHGLTVVRIHEAVSLNPNARPYAQEERTMQYVAPAPARNYANRAHTPSQMRDVFGDLIAFARMHGFHVCVETQSGSVYEVFPIGRTRFHVLRGGEGVASGVSLYVRVQEGRLFVDGPTGRVIQSTPIERMEIAVRSAY